MHEHEIDLATAASRLHLSWHQAYRLVLTGALSGRRVAGRWFVDAEDLRRLQVERPDTPRKP